jgi:hypothetical protein
MADGCILESLSTPGKSYIRNELFGKGTALTKNVPLSTFVLLTGVAESAVMVNFAVRVMVGGHFAATAVQDLAIESSGVSVALSVRVPVGK